MADQYTPGELTFPCDQCDDTFSSSKDWMAHVRKADNHEAICKACDKSFTNFDNLRHHKRKYHYEKSEFMEVVCDSCGKGFKTKDLLKDHWNFVHKIETDLNCNLCARSCQNMLKLKKHTQFCLSRDPEIVSQERLQFEELVKKYQSDSFINSSEARPSGSGTKATVAMEDNSCSIFCNETDKPISPRSDSIKSEDKLLIVVEMDVKQESAVSEEFEESHIVESKLDGFSKSEENEYSNQIDELDDVIKAETEPEILTPVQKRIRIRNKTSVAVVAKVCPICAKEVKYLNVHIRDVHTETPAEYHICNHCGKVFSKAKKLRGHIDAAHKVQPTMCDICSQVFKNNHALGGHKRKVHKAMSKVTCPFCFKVFENKLKLYDHERAVHTLEDSKCQACGKTYKNKNLLQKHVKVYHNNLYEHHKNISNS